MKPEIKKKWIEALRSGEYEQAQGSLKTPSNKFCCLGVLCEIHREEVDDTEWDGIFLYGESDLLPTKVKNWAGLERNDPRVDDLKGATLATINDLGVDFNYIADVIEEQL